MAGARVVPIYYDGDEEYYDNMFKSLNGILFPGGGAEIGKNTLLTKNAKYIFEKAIEANKNGVHFPLWGTCLGFELLS